jgi:4-diphosphocytidyl-2-C-methyl-D-erythritol kinase
MHEIALSLGSDVPFFLVGGRAYATGRGEQLTLLPAGAPIPLLLLFPHERVSTAEAFSLIREYSKPVGVDRYRQAVDLLDHTDILVNDFEKVILPRLPNLKNRLLEARAAWAGMTGSGSTIVGAFRGQEQRDVSRASFNDVRCEVAETR